MERYYAEIFIRLYKVYTVLIEFLFSSQDSKLFPTHSIFGFNSNQFILEGTKKSECKNIHTDSFNKSIQKLDIKLKFHSQKKFSFRYNNL